MVDAVSTWDDDRLAAERIAMGDEAAFAAVYDRHSALVYGAVVRFVGDREAAAEVVQDAFMALWRRANQFDASSGSLAGWLLGIARHRAIDRYRAESRRPTAAAVSLADSFTNAEPVFADTASGTRTSIQPRWLSCTGANRSFARSWPTSPRASATF
jgi:RNA polymerase sigma-70 factor, ECF subfamily